MGKIIYLLMVLLLSGCGFVFSSATVNLTDNLSKSILNNNDLATVEIGGPAYLLMIDSMIAGDPDNISLLRTATNLYSAYTGVFVQDHERVQRLMDRALNYGLQMVCKSRSNACSLQSSRFREFEKVIAAMDAQDVPNLYSLGSVWAGWIQAHSEDMNAVAELSRVETIMQRVIELDEFYHDGGAHVYLGVLDTLIPQSLGGKPEAGRRHFERAMEIAGDKNLMVQVTFAEKYARLMFNRELHDDLLRQVIEADPVVPGYTLINTFAQKKARKLLETADDHF